MFNRLSNNVLGLPNIKSSCETSTFYHRTSQASNFRSFTSIRGVFRTQWNIYDEPFFRKQLTAFSPYLLYKLNFRCSNKLNTSLTVSKNWKHKGAVIKYLLGWGARYFLRDKKKIGTPPIYGAVKFWSPPPKRWKDFWLTLPPQPYTLQCVVKKVEHLKYFSRPWTLVNSKVLLH